MNKRFSFIKSKENYDLKEILLNGISTFAFKITGLLLAYLVMLFITRTFGSEVFGRYSIAITFSQLLVLIFTFGLPVSIISLLSDTDHFDKQPKTNFLKKVMIITFVSSIIISVSLFFISEIIALHLFNDQSLTVYFKILSYFIVPLMFHEILINFFRGKKEFKKYNLFIFVLPPLLFICIFYLLLKSYTNEFVTILSFGLSLAIVFIIELIFYRFLNYMTKTNYPTKKLFKLSFPMMLSSTVLFLLNWTDIFMLGAMVTSKEVGIYNLAFKIASIGLLIIIAMNVVIGPKIAELYNKNDLDSLRKITIKSTQIIALLTIPLILIIQVFRIEILTYFGYEFAQGEVVLLILSFGVLINAVSGNVDQILNMTNNQKIMRNLTVFCLIENIILNALLIPHYGITGAAVASLVTHFSLNIASIYYIKKRLGFYTFI
jgi:O-antigen/teichoic acid export membrane protein